MKLRLLVQSWKQLTEPVRATILSIVRLHAVEKNRPLNGEVNRQLIESGVQTVRPLYRWKSASFKVSR